MDKIQYCKFDPTGNITALVETAVDIADQPAVASKIMEQEPDVEQVGFITYDDTASAEESVPVSLRMAGGEFCGNATMCAAALFAIRSGMRGGAEPVQVNVRVSGASAPLTVSLEQQAAFSYSAAVCMPPALKIGKVSLQTSAVAGDRPETGPEAAAGGHEDVSADVISAELSLPVVEMEGISHIIIEPDSGFLGLKDDPALAESMLRHWCGVLGADCLGMMFLGEGAALRPLTPLVYVPGADTMFWENSCASGSAAAGMYLAAKAGSPVDITFEEPAGRLRVESDPASGRTILHGSTIMRSSLIFS
ncbi:MAG: hypothetical protein IJJ06_03340 [Mogibacterium sp.]|nr:hypothetical protein [Mogibacterium sp.]